MGAEKQIYKPPDSVHVCSSNGLMNTFVTPGRLLLSILRQMVRITEESIPIATVLLVLFVVVAPGVNGPSHSQ